MKMIEIRDATAALKDYADDLGEDDTIVLTENGLPVAALTAIDAEDLESAQVAASDKFWEIILRARERYVAEGGISTEDLRAELGIEA